MTPLDKKLGGKATKQQGPSDILPTRSVDTNVNASAEARSREIALEKRSLTTEASTFFNKDGDARKISVETQRATDSIGAGLGPKAKGGSPTMDAAMNLNTAGMRNAFTPDIGSVSTFGLPSPDNPSYDEGSLRESLRKILRKL